MNLFVTTFFILFIVAKTNEQTTKDNFFLTSMLGLLISGFFATYYGIFFALFLYRNYPFEETLVVLTFLHLPIVSSAYLIYKYNKINDS